MNELFSSAGLASQILYNIIWRKKVTFENFPVFNMIDGKVQDTAITQKSWLESDHIVSFWEGLGTGFAKNSSNGSKSQPEIQKYQIRLPGFYLQN